MIIHTYSMQELEGKWLTYPTYRRVLLKLLRYEGGVVVACVERARY